jgi:hypothetical protein
MVSTISFIQANLQHSIAASRILTRTVSTKGIQELWYRENCIKGLNIPGYTLYSAGGTDRPRACIPVGSMTSWMLPGFSCRDLVAVLVKCFEDGVERQLVVCSAYLPYDFEDPPPTKELRNSCDAVRMNISILSWGATPMCIKLHGVAPTVMIEGKPWWNFSVRRIWRF